MGAAEAAAGAVVVGADADAKTSSDAEIYKHNTEVTNCIEDVKMRERTAPGDSGPQRI